MALGSRPPRSAHRRGRSWLFLAVLASVLVLLANAALSARSPAPARQAAQQSYLDQALPAIQQSTQQGLDLGNVRSQALSLSTSVITSHLSQLATEAQQTLNSVTRLNPLAFKMVGNEAMYCFLSHPKREEQEPQMNTDKCRWVR